MREKQGGIKLLTGRRDGFGSVILPERCLLGRNNRGLPSRNLQTLFLCDNTSSHPSVFGVLRAKIYLLRYGVNSSAVAFYRVSGESCLRQPSFVFRDLPEVDRERGGGEKPGRIAMSVSMPEYVPVEVWPEKRRRAGGGTTSPFDPYAGLSEGGKKFPEAGGLPEGRGSFGSVRIADRRKRRDYPLPREERRSRRTNGHCRCAVKRGVAGRSHRPATPLVPSPGIEPGLPV